jgi:hypothetical protein
MVLPDHSLRGGTKEEVQVNNTTNHPAGQYVQAGSAYSSNMQSVLQESALASAHVPVLDAQAASHWMYSCTCTAATAAAEGKQQGSCNYQTRSCNTVSTEAMVWPPAAASDACADIAKCAATARYACYSHPAMLNSAGSLTLA